MANPVLKQCIETENVGTPFSYTVYGSYQECVNSAESGIDSSIMMGSIASPKKMSGNCAEKWFIDADRNRCTPTYLASAPFSTQKDCEQANSQCDYAGRPVLQFSNAVQATDVYWKLGNQTEGPISNIPQIGLNPPDRPIVVGTHQILPGTAGQGYSVY